MKRHYRQCISAITHPDYATLVGPIHGIRQFAFFKISGKPRFYFFLLFFAKKQQKNHRESPTELHLTIKYTKKIRHLKITGSLSWL